jgi:hypothetical protein
MANLNKWRISVNVPDAPELSFNASHLTDDMVTISADSAPSAVLQLAVGTLNVKETTMMRSITFTLDKTQPKADLWRARISSNCEVGDVPIQGLAPNIKDTIRNATITKGPDYDETGRSAGLQFTLTGYVLVNTDLI